MTMEIEPTAEDRARARTLLENPGDRLFETLARREARLRVEREQRERRRTLLRKLTLGVLGR